MIATNFDSKTFFHFDLDGTLLNTQSANLYAYQKSVIHFGGKWTDEASNLLSQGERSEIFLKKCLQIKHEQVTLIQNYKRKIYPEEFGKINVIEPVFNLLNTVTPKAALVTSASRIATDQLLDFFELRIFFSHVITSEDVKLNKPNPECYLKSKLLAKSKYGFISTHVAIEDSEIGSSSAKIAGMKVLDVRELL